VLGNGIPSYIPRMADVPGGQFHHNSKHPHAADLSNICSLLCGGLAAAKTRYTARSGDLR
jgi:hypothetical protein